jgi:hypothetical protein
LGSEEENTRTRWKMKNRRISLEDDVMKRTFALNLKTRALQPLEFRSVEEEMKVMNRRLF